MTLRVNSQKTSDEEYLALLDTQGIKATQHKHSGIVLEQPCDVFDLPKFEEGFASVQDASAQLAATLLPIASGNRVLDCCAAPGGKTSHLLELNNDIELIAIDIDETRLKRINENLERLHLKAEVECCDALRFGSSEPFDAILLDAPCSATGVIRRHPDIKLLRREKDIQQLAEIQFQLLKHLWSQLKENGYLLYCTCSILPDENERVIKRFLKN